MTITKTTSRMVAAISIFPPAFSCGTSCYYTNNTITSAPRQRPVRDARTSFNRYRTVNEQIVISVCRSKRYGGLEASYCLESILVAPLFLEATCPLAPSRRKLFSLNLPLGRLPRRLLGFPKRRLEWWPVPKESAT